ncbi:MAG: hypothetical protein ACOH14_05695 [Rhodoglobus sp.]
MNSGCAQNRVIAKHQRSRVAAAAASAFVVIVALAGCVPSEPISSATPTASPTASTEASPSPLPTPEPLIVPGCESLLPLVSAKELFSEQTEVLDEADVVPVSGEELPEIVTVGSNASIAKNCVWGVPNSDGFFVLTIADINKTDAASLKAALLSSGYLGVTEGGITTLELETEDGIGSRAYTHYLVGDLWIYVLGTSLGLTIDVANSALAEVRLANPTRTY